MTLSTASLLIKTEPSKTQAISHEVVISEGLGSFFSSIAYIPNNEDGELLTQFFKMLPKVELHAHLNGCIRESTLFELAAERNVTLSSLLHELQLKTPAKTRMGGKGQDEYFKHENKKRRSLTECFKIFSEISKCVTDLEAITRITREALEDFAEQNVAYLELRSTPKSLKRKFSCGSSVISKCTKREYVETILRVMEDFATKEQKRYEREIRDWEEEQTIDLHGGDSSIRIRLPLIPRFIVSIDRSGTIDDANEHAALAIEFAKEKNPYVVGLDLSGDPMKVCLQILFV
jgi:adenosine deaminase